LPYPLSADANRPRSISSPAAATRSAAVPSITPRSAPRKSMGTGRSSVSSRARGY